MRWRQLKASQFTLLSEDVGGVSESEKRAWTDASGASFPGKDVVPSLAYTSRSSVPSKWLVSISNPCKTPGVPSRMIHLKLKQRSLCQTEMQRETVPVKAWVVSPGFPPRIQRTVGTKQPVHTWCRLSIEADYREKHHVLLSSHFDLQQMKCLGKEFVRH